MFSTTARLARDAHRTVSNNGEYALYLLSFSEQRQVKQKDGSWSKEYTNYSANIVTKINGKQDDFYGQMLTKGNVIGIYAENIYPHSREHDGKTYLEIRLDQARLTSIVAAVKRETENQQRQSNGGNQNQQQYSGQQQNNNGWGASQNQQQGGQIANGNGNHGRNEPPMDFDDDIPF